MGKQELPALLPGAGEPGNHEPPAVPAPPGCSTWCERGVRGVHSAIPPAVGHLVGEDDQGAPGMFTSVWLAMVSIIAVTQASGFPDGHSANSPSSSGQTHRPTAARPTLGPAPPSCWSSISGVERRGPFRSYHPSGPATVGLTVGQELGTPSVRRDQRRVWFPDCPRRSRSTCHRMAGSPSSSQATTSSGVDGWAAMMVRRAGDHRPAVGVLAVQLEGEFGPPVRVGLLTEFPQLRGSMLAPSTSRRCGPRP